MRRPSLLALVAATLLCLSGGRTAVASVDLTGAFSVVAQTIVGPYEVAFELVQTGTQLDLTYRFGNNPPAGPYTGTIDPDTGVFTIPLPDSGSPISCSGSQIAGTATADGQSISGYWTAMFVTIHLFCQDGGGPFTGARNYCGDGIVGGSEACDDTGGCCSADCATAAPDGTACDDGDACTNGETCGAASCGNGTPLYCQPCESCSPDGCVVADDGGCAPVLGGGKSTISMRHKAGAPEKDNLTWQWKNGAPMSVEELGEPVEFLRSYHLCVIDHSGGVPTLRMRRAVPSGPDCTADRCWKQKKTGWSYASKTGQPEGLTSVQLGAGDVGRGKIRVKGKGAALATPAGGLAGAVIVRLQRDDAPVCWDATFTTPKKNDGTIFKAKSD
jgi:hypothetical protein